MMLNATFNNISAFMAIYFYWWRSGGSHWQTWSHNVVSNTSRHELDSKFQL